MVTPRWYLYAVIIIVSLFKITAMARRELRGRKWDIERNLLWYKTTHPELVGDSWVECFTCNGKIMHVRDMGRASRVIMNSHICAMCGTELYRSTTLR